MLQPYAAHTVIFRTFLFFFQFGLFPSDNRHVNVIRIPYISDLFHEGMASSAMTSQRQKSGEVSDAVFSGRKTSRQFDHGL